MIHGFKKLLISRQAPYFPTTQKKTKSEKKLFFSKNKKKLGGTWQIAYIPASRLGRSMHSRGITTTITILPPVPFSRGGQKMANPVREMNIVADGRKGDPQQDVEGKNSLISIGIFFEKIAIFIKNVSVIKPYLAGAFLGLTPSKLAPGS